MTCNNIWSLFQRIHSKNAHTYDLFSVASASSPEAELDRLALKALPENVTRNAGPPHSPLQSGSAPREVFSRAM